MNDRTEMIKDIVVALIRAGRHITAESIIVQQATRITDAILTAEGDEAPTEERSANSNAAKLAPHNELGVFKSNVDPAAPQKNANLRKVIVYGPDAQKFRGWLHTWETCGAGAMDPCAIVELEDGSVDYFSVSDVWFTEW